MRSISKEKYEQLIQFLVQQKIDMLVISDNENSRNVNLQYLSGHPQDGIFILTSKGDNALIPWDLLLAKDHADVDKIYDMKQFNYSSVKMFKSFVEEHNIPATPVIGVSSNYPYGNILSFEKHLKGCKVYKEPQLIDQKLGDLRATKTPFELDRLVDVCKLSDIVLNDIIKFARNCTDETENDLSFMVLKRMKELGAEDLSFPSLVANTERSHQLHCHPMASNAQFGKQGFSIIDFGAKLKGYCSDTTQPFVFGNLSSEQQKMMNTVQEAYDRSIDAIEIGVPLHEIGSIARNILESAGYSMNYALGHGIGLSEHDSPIISSKPTDPASLEYWHEVKVEEGMVFTIEPGAYVKGQGGCRLENDVMIRDGKVKVITSAKFEIIN